jgi:two-component system response regulator PhoP
MLAWTLFTVHDADFCRLKIKPTLSLEPHPSLILQPLSVFVNLTLEMRVLIVEDEKRLAGNISQSLRESAGYAVDYAPDGSEGLHMAQSNAYDVIILDLMLPGMDGRSVLQQLRGGGCTFPVLVLTARDDKETLIEVLNDGADDYLCKPFDLGELIARVKVLIRRGKGQTTATLRFGKIEVNTADRTVRRAGTVVGLTGMEYRVIEYLAHRRGAVVTKTELLEHLYDFNWERFSNVIEVYISGLRRKLENAGTEKVIHTIRGHGYTLKE